MTPLRVPIAVHPFTLRRISTLDADKVENPGIYLVLDGTPASDTVEYDTWRYLVLVGDSDLDDDKPGAIRIDRSGWLADWSEPWEP